MMSEISASYILQFWMFLFIIHATRACTHSTVYNREECNSFAELDAEGTEEWTNAYVQRHYNNRPRVVLGANTFFRTPNLMQLTVHALVREIEPGAFTGLNRLDKLFIIDNELPTIDPGIFQGLNIRELQLLNNGMKEFPMMMFREIPRVRLVVISRNDIKVIPVGVFNGTSIWKLFMQGNGFEVIEEGAFFNMTVLEGLNLHNNKLSTFDSKVIIGYNPTFERIRLSMNKFTKITNNMFTTLPNLGQIFFDMNQIDDIEHDAFLHVPELQYLDLSNNLIEEVHPSIATKNGLMKLSVFVVQNNRLTYINTLLLSKFPKLEYMAFGGNPFQCPCLDQIKNWLAEKNITQMCDDTYHVGERPSCVISAVSATACIYDMDLNKDLYQLYVNALREYGANENLKCDTTKGVQNAVLVKS